MLRAFIQKNIGKLKIVYARNLVVRKNAYMNLLKDVEQHGPTIY